PLALGWCFVGLALMRRRSGTAKAVLFNLAFFALAFAAIEAYFAIPKPVQRDRDPEGDHQLHDVLGYRPVPGVIPDHKRYRDETIFDVTYRIGEDSLRITPDAPGDLPCVLFFGGSYGFGLGVADDETFAYRVGLAAIDRFRTYNFSYNGYGPHQMLAALESGLVDRTIECEPRHVIYLAIGNHLMRVAGLAAWDPHGPWYELVDGELIRRGNFDDQFRVRAAQQIRRSHLGEQVVQVRSGREPERHARLYGHIVAAAGREVERSYPGAELHVIVWGDHAPDGRVVLESLAEHGLKSHRLSKIFPDYAENRDTYRVSPHDSHPSAFAHARLADYILAEVLASPKP
ncbi:MAG: hypothetical protein MJB57_02995, partial [Gemmatimonadetes bacterium]|nr:hypothetical protein [Gemmatimonadota bacterium]